MAHQTEELRRYFEQKLSVNSDLAFSFEDIQFGVSEMDSVIKEISICLILDLFQASITLTNHLLEKSLKLFLIYSETSNKQFSTIDELNQQFRPASLKYMSKDLNNTIEIACSKKFITKSEKKILHNYRVRIRNGFSHADASKIFKDMKVPIAKGNFVMNSPIELGEVDLEHVPFLHGIFQDKLAENISFEYYSFVLEIIKRNVQILK